MLRIQSLQNQKVKDLIRLRDARARKQSKCFLVEGAREIERAIRCEFEPLQFWVCRELVSEASHNLLKLIEPSVMIEVSEAVYEKIAVRESKDGVCAVFSSRERDLNDLLVEDSSVILAVQGLEKPGNLGAMLRTAEGLGVKAVVLLDPKSDLWNPIAIRASLGTIFSIPVYEATSERFYNFCQSRKIKTYSALLSPKSESIFTTKFSDACAIVLGTEDEGLSQFWMENADFSVMVPMAGIADSFNVSVAAGILLFEVMRQRKS